MSHLSRNFTGTRILLVNFCVVCIAEQIAELHVYLAGSLSLVLSHWFLKWFAHKSWLPSWIRLWLTLYGYTNLDSKGTAEMCHPSGAHASNWLTLSPHHWSLVPALLNSWTVLVGLVRLRNLTCRVDAILRWRIHCSGPDFTRIIYAVMKFHGLIRTWSCVWGVCACRETCRLARISCHVGWVPKWHLKGTSKLFTGFLRCVRVSHDLDCLDVPYRGIHVDCNIELMFKVGVLDIDAHTFRSSFSVSLALWQTNELLNFWHLVDGKVVHLYLDFLYKVSVSKYLLHWDFI